MFSVKSVVETLGIQSQKSYENEYVVENSIPVNAIIKTWVYDADDVYNTRNKFEKDGIEMQGKRGPALEQWKRSRKSPGRLHRDRDKFLAKLRENMEAAKTLGWKVDADVLATGSKITVKKSRDERDGVDTGTRKGDEPEKKEGQKEKPRKLKKSRANLSIKFAPAEQCRYLIEEST